MNDDDLITLKDASEMLFGGRVSPATLEGGTEREAGAGVSQRFDQILASRAWPPDFCSGCRASGQTLSKAELYDALRSCEVPDGCKADKSSCAIFHYWLVHGLAALGDRITQVVDDRS